MIKVKRLTNDAILPKKGREGDACYDLYTSKDIYLLDKDGRIKIPTGIAVELPSNFEAEIRPRSGISLKGLEVLRISDDINVKVRIDVIQGTIDSNYRGEINIIVDYETPYKVLIPRFTKLAQMKINHVPEVEFVEVEELSESNRGANGFGSSGV